jgi:dodecin
MAADSLYTIVELVGTSPVSWEDAAKKAVEAASKSLRELRIAEIVQQDLKVENGKITAFRVRIKLSFKYES